MIKEWFYKTFVTNSTLGVLKYDTPLTKYYENKSTIKKIFLFLTTVAVRIFVDIFNWITAIVIFGWTTLKTFLYFTNILHNDLATTVSEEFETYGWLIYFIVEIIVLYLIFLILEILVRLVVVDTYGIIHIKLINKD